MPRNQFQRTIFALLTVIITVHAFIFYSLYVVNGATFMTVTHEGSVISAINKMGGVYMLFGYRPIWVLVIAEFCLAFCLEVFMGSPVSFKLASKVFNPAETNPVIFESAIICATVGIMCPAMSLIAAFLYYPFNFIPFNIFTFFANWIKLLCFNLPFAFFTQLFFIQPLVRTVFKKIFAKDIASRVNQ